MMSRAAQTLLAGRVFETPALRVAAQILLSQSFLLMFAAYIWCLRLLNKGWLGYRKRKKVK